MQVPTEDQSGMHYKWQVERDGRVAGTAHGITAWDPGKKNLRTVGFALPGFLVESNISAWVIVKEVVFSKKDHIEYS